MSSSQISIEPNSDTITRRKKRNENILLFQFEIIHLDLFPVFIFEINFFSRFVKRVISFMILNDFCGKYFSVVSFNAISLRNNCHEYNRR